MVYTGLDNLAEVEQIGKQIKVPGSFWDGRMSADERTSFYKCT